jgi:hypothetical protein
MSGDPKECLAYAKVCMKLASQARLPSDKRYFEELAQRWLHLARDIEVAHALLATFGKQDGKPHPSDGSDRGTTPAE